MLNLKSLCVAVALTLGLGSCAATVGQDSKFEFGFFEAQVSRDRPRDWPVAILFGGSEGGIWGDAPLVAALDRAGMRVATVAYFRFPDGPPELSEIDVDALSDFVAEQTNSPACTGVLGVSKGGELSLVLAAYRNVSAATVAVVPSNVVWQSSQISVVQRSSWRLGDAPLPFVPYRRFTTEAVRAVLDLRDALPLHETALARATDAAMIPVERIRTPVLLQAARNDQVWPSFAMAQAAVARADARAPGHQIQMKAYNADHFLFRDAAARTDAVRFLRDNLRASCR